MDWRTHAKIITVLVLAGAAGGYWYLQSDDKSQQDIATLQGKIPDFKEMRPEYVVPTINIAKLIGWQGEAKPVAAKGLAVNAFADKLDHPRWLYELPNGDVLVAETTQPDAKDAGLMGRIASNLMKKANGSDTSANRITLLRDKNKDGKAEERHVLLSAENGLHSPFGMALLDGKLYVANTNALIAFPYKSGDTKIAGKGEKIVDLPANAPNSHWVRNVIVAPDGKGLLVTVGSNSNIAEGGMAAEKDRAGILEVDPLKKRYTIFANGLRNPVGLAIDPKSGYMWTTVNERDMLGSDGPPDYLTWVDRGTFFGWPWFYWGGQIDHRVEPTNHSRRQYSRRPDYALGPHTASLGLAFSAKAKLGSAFANGAFIGQHGSWNRNPLSGYKVVFVPFNDRGFAEGKMVDVLTGFLNDKQEAQGRPAGVLVDAQGALLVADDAGNRIWRVSAAATKTP